MNKRAGLRRIDRVGLRRTIIPLLFAIAHEKQLSLRKLLEAEVLECFRIFGEIPLSLL